MRCKVCGAESGKYILCRSCNAKKKAGEIIKCERCGQWHYYTQPCPPPPAALQETYLYTLKSSLISHTESAFFLAIKAAVPEGFCVFPQINLASFIDRTDDARYRNELFRNVDFLITDAAYQPKIVIEINDQTHNTAERRERDEKVRKICEEAGIPLIRLWTSYGVNSAYIKSRIAETLQALPVARVHHFSQVSPTPMPVTPPPAAIPAQSVKKKKGCYIATCVYGSYDCPPVWVLRRYRDTTLSKTWYGRMFIHLYYAVSPICVKLFGQKSWFQSLCRKRLDIVVDKLQADGYENLPYFDSNEVI